MVMQKIDQLNIHVTPYDIMLDQQARKKLIDDTGRQTVPCLYIDGKPMHESGDIVEWLDKNQENLQKRKDS